MRNEASELKQNTGNVAYAVLVDVKLTDLFI